MDKGFGGVMETFDNTRPIVAAMAVGVARAALEELRTILTEAGVEISYDMPAHAQNAAAAEFLRMEAEWEAGYLLTVRSAWQADNKIPNSKEASMGKAKAARVATDITLKAVEMAGTTGYSERDPAGEVGARLGRSSTSSKAPSRSSSSWWPRRLLGLSSRRTRVGFLRARAGRKLLQNPCGFGQFCVCSASLGWRRMDTFQARRRPAD